MIIEFMKQDYRAAEFVGCKAGVYDRWPNRCRPGSCSLIPILLAATILAAV
jgi:hypothetical protein